MRSIDFVTVATVDYTPQALATLRSARRHGGYASFHFFVLDGAPQALTALREILAGDPWIQIFGPENLQAAHREVFLTSFRYYTAFELSCFSKYVALAHVMGRPDAADFCVYSDADIYFLSPVEDACTELGDGIALLTPHNLGPTNDASEHEFLLNGWINAGFLCFRRHQPELARLLDWLISRIARRGFWAPGMGLFLDQAWISSLPFVFHGQTVISENPALNVAYWNLNERELTERDGVVFVNGRPLRFFHFSGFDPANPSLLSRHADVRVAPSSPVQRLWQAYRDELEVASTVGERVRALPRLPCSRAPLAQRIAIGSEINQLSISAPTFKTGIFTRIGRRLDFVLSRLSRG
ncbi:MAG TPA: hypothetical protein VG821_12245 [Rhizomicrobium sp.]|nr:hypothetical protein [Rhizomicrobium sp.]